jgi:hypothetical protein
MPKFAILVTRDETNWWHYVLVVNYKATHTTGPFETADAAFKAAKNTANVKGLLPI